MILEYILLWQQYILMILSTYTKEPQQFDDLFLFSVPVPVPVSVPVSVPVFQLRI